jgi:NADPH-dependent curcumin reductase CurA
VGNLEAALDTMKTFGRIVLCGMISQYNATSPTPGPSNIFLAITNSGFKDLLSGTIMI